MNIETAKEDLNALLKQRNEKEVTIEIRDLFGSIETVLSELEKKDKVINEMAGQIFYWQDDKFPLGYSKKDVIDFYTNKVEREGK